MNPDDLPGDRLLNAYMVWLHANVKDEVWARFIAEMSAPPAEVLAEAAQQQTDPGAFDAVMAAHNRRP